MFSPHSAKSGFSKKSSANYAQPNIKTDRVESSNSKNQFTVIITRASKGNFKFDFLVLDHK